jgi:hypothetical protein
LSFPKISVPVIVVIVVLVVLVSLAYPSVTLSSVTSQTISYVVISAGSYTTGYPQSASTVVLANQITSTAWYLGNLLCDPASMACTPQAFPTATMTYTEWSTYPYQVTVYSQIQTSYTTESTSLLTQTNYQTVPPYAAAGLNDLQFGLSVLLIFGAFVAGILFLFAKKNRDRTVQILKLNVCF